MRLKPGPRSQQATDLARLALLGGKPVRTKPFPEWPQHDREDEEAILQVVRSGKWWMYAYGTEELVTAEGEAAKSRVERFEEAFAKAQHVRHAFAVTSGTAALEICCRALGIGPGDEVITTPYTFVSTSSCVLNAYGLPVYVDIEPDTYNIDPDLIEGAITKHTKAIIPVHFGGAIADMDKIREIADRHGLKVIEDAAQAHGASLKEGRYAGSLSDLGIFSMQQSKLLTCGEGGIITTQDDRLAELAWSLRHVGREPKGLWYEHFRLGWNYRMTELQAAILLTQLAKMEAQNATREKNVEYFFSRLRKIPGIEPTRQNTKAERKVYYLVILRYDGEQWDGLPRDRLVEALKAEGMPVLSGYSFPTYENPVFQQIDFNSPGSPYNKGHKAKIDFARYRGACPVAEHACHQEAIWIPHQVFLGSKNDVDDLYDGIVKIRENLNELLERESHQPH